jgi:hypothetical protein
MLGEDFEFKEKFEELERKFEAFESELEELSNPVLEEGSSQGFSESSDGGGALFKIHWVQISETSFESCDDVGSVEDAQKAFKEAADARGKGMSSKEVLHGDIMVLLCNRAKEEDEDTDEVTYTDACYYIGMCVNIDSWHQDENPVSDIKIAGNDTLNGSVVRQFIAWDSCGGESCPEEPDTIQLDELIPPESAGDETDIKGIEITTDFSSPLSAKVHELKTLSFTKKEDENSDGDDEDAPIEYVLLKNGEPSYEGGNTSKLTGSLFNFSNIVNEAADGFDVSADVTQVSLSSSTARIEEVTYKAKTYNLQPTEISSDSCGVLKKENAKNEEDEPLPKVPVEILTKSDVSGSSYDISSLSVTEGSKSVSLGTLDLTSLMVTDSPYISGSSNPYFFVPSITTAQGDSIKQEAEIELLTDFKIDITQASAGDNCTTITITPSTKKETFTFHSGLLTNKTDDDSWESGTSSNFTFNNCIPECSVSSNSHFFSTLKVYWDGNTNGDLIKGTLLETWSWSGPRMVSGSTTVAEFTQLDFTDHRNSSNSRTVNDPLGSDQCIVTCATSNLDATKTVLMQYPPRQSGGIGEDEGNEIVSGNFKYNLS